MDKKWIKERDNDVLGAQLKNTIFDMEDILMGRKARAKYERIERAVKEGKLTNSSSFLM